MRRLGGWQRIWIVLTVLWTLIVVATSYAAWPREIVSTDPNAGKGTPTEERILFERLEARAAALASKLDLVADILRRATVTDPVRRDAWNAASQAETTDDLIARIRSLPLADDVRTDILEARFPFAHASEDQTDLEALARKYGGVPIEEWNALRRDNPLTDRELHIGSAMPSASAMFTREEQQRLLKLREEDSEKTQRRNREERVMAVRTAFGFWAVPPIVVYALGWSIGWIRRGFHDKRG